MIEPAPGILSSTRLGLLLGSTHRGVEPGRVVLQQAKEHLNGRAKK